MANVDTVPFEFVKKANLSFCQVVWQRYLGEVGQFYRTLWLICPRHCISISKSVKYCKVMTNKMLVCFYAKCSLGYFVMFFIRVKILMIIFFINRYFPPPPRWRRRWICCFQIATRL